ncbi:MAG: hypothetical protein ACT4P1_03480 [Sporichthyaceae bacterium]
MTSHQRDLAGRVLLLIGVLERAVTGLMGWSNTAMAARYQHITTAVQRAADRVGELLWSRSPAKAPPRAHETAMRPGAKRRIILSGLPGVCAGQLAVAVGFEL